MSLTLQLVIAVAVGLAASSLIIALDFAQQPLLLVAVVTVACCTTALLSRGAKKPPTVKSRDVKDEREEGEVKWFNVSKGFGFIRRQNGEEIFVHYRSIREPTKRETGRTRGGHRGSGRERRALRDGQRVSFVVVSSDKGPQAEEVEALR